VEIETGLVSPESNAVATEPVGRPIASMWVLVLTAVRHIIHVIWSHVTDWK